MVFKINGTDITPYIATGGLQWSRNDLDGPNAGRAMDGTMYRDRVAIKYKWDITCKPLTAQEAAIVLSLLEPEFITVTTTNPMTNTVESFESYSNNVPAQYLMNIGGKEYWTGITFPIVQR